jgi:hypothetical protein
MTNPPRPPGRPRHDIEGIKRSPLTLHITDALKDELRYEAQASGRSLTQEVEYRLRWSLSEHRARERPLAEIRLDFLLAEIGELVKANWANPEIAAAAAEATVQRLSAMPPVVSVEAEELVARPRARPRKSKSRRP